MTIQPTCELWDDLVKKLISNVYARKAQPDIIATRNSSNDLRPRFSTDTSVYFSQSCYVTGHIRKRISFS